MCVSFEPEVIYKNAFYAYQLSNESGKLKRRDIVTFCDILQEQITKNATKNAKYKYVHFDFDEDSLSIFYNAHFDIFHEIGHDIYISKEIQDNEIKDINYPYDDNVKNAIEKTRQEFCNYLISNLAKQH